MCCSKVATWLAGPSMSIYFLELCPPRAFHYELDMKWFNTWLASCSWHRACEPIMLRLCLCICHTKPAHRYARKHTHAHSTLPYKEGVKHPARSSNLFALTTPSWQFQCRHLLRMDYISMTPCSCWVQAPSLRSWQSYQRLRPVTLVEHLSLARISSFLVGIEK